MFGPLRRAAAVLVVFLLAACAGGPSAEAPAPTYPDVSGVWLGGVDVEGQTIDGTLELTQDGSDLEAVFTSPGVGLTAEGSGTISADGEVRIVLGYNLQCPGTAEMLGDRSADGQTLSGLVQASDCTGQIEGAFDFRR
jgi:hypothetical protein